MEMSAEMFSIELTFYLSSHRFCFFLILTGLLHLPFPLSAQLRGETRTVCTAVCKVIAVLITWE